MKCNYFFRLLNHLQKILWLENLRNTDYIDKQTGVVQDNTKYGIQICFVVFEANIQNKPEVSLFRKFQLRDLKQSKTIKKLLKLIRCHDKHYRLHFYE